MIICGILLLAMLLSPFNLRAGNGQQHALESPAVSSVLASGKWFKIKIYQDGIYRLDYTDISAMGFSNPAGIRIYGNGGKMLPLMNAASRQDDLVENAIFMNKGADGIFNQGDYVLFFGKGPVSWSYNAVSGMFEHRLNQFSAAAYYFITTGEGTGSIITEAPPVTGSPDIEVTDFDDYAFHELNKYNFLKSGRQWFGERVDYAAYDTVVVFTGLQISSPVKLKANVLSRSASVKTFQFMNNSAIIGTINVPGVILSNTTGIYAQQKSGAFSFPVTGDQVQISILYNKSESSDEGYLDYLTINARRELALSGNSTFFRDASVAGSDGIARWSVKDCNPQTEIWDLTDQYTIKRIPSQLNGSTLEFSDSTHLLKEYAAVNTAAQFPKPEFTPSGEDVGQVANQNLHATAACQMLIITHPLFKEAADSIAELHRKKDNLSVSVICTDAIYNEFSSGARDVAAIRDLAKMVYDRATGDHDRLRYLLLVGDGSYNNISLASGNSNYILTYQSESSLNASTSYVSDDFFGFMDDDEGGSESMEDYSLDLGVGRLPVKTAEEAMGIYRKIRYYNTGDNKLDWRNNILFAGDDEDGNLHMTQANSLAEWINENYPVFFVKKVFLDAYPQVASSSGARYPDVNRILNDNIQKGLLIFNYTGHGGEAGLAAEHILMKEDLTSMTNFDNLPLFVTATCEFSRFDDLMDDEGVISENTSAGELSLLNPAGGSIALFTTTRIVYSDRNHYLNSKFYHVVFRRDENGNFFKLGDVVRMAKDSSGLNQNKLNFILLGDPALTLAIPKYSIVTDSLNGVSVYEALDTLKAFSRIRVSGHLEDIDHQPITDYMGIIYPSVFDKDQVVTTLANDGGETMQFSTRENLLYKGKASIKNGSFSFDFMVPKDITYSFGTGKIVYYAQDTTSDANGSFSNFIIGGTNPEAIPDLAGPDISLYLNDEYFNNEGITNENPVIYARISDESGINTIGNGIGHDITGVIDGNVADPVVLNEYFEADLDNFTQGSLRYTMTGLTEGWHSLTVRVWDVFNNSSETTITFQVITGSSIIMANLFNYPNPASEVTWFTFEHNKPDEVLQVTISIYDMAGRNVAILDESLSTTGFSLAPLEWDLKDQSGNPLRQGIYPYRVRITDSNGSYTESFQKLVIIRQ
jgi:hypothetical protein